MDGDYMGNEGKQAGESISFSKEENNFESTEVIT